MKEETVKKLYETFELRERAGLGGMRFKYVPSDGVIDRMNRLFRANWSTKVITQERMDDAVVVRVRVGVFDTDSGAWFEHDGYGSSAIMRYTAGDKRGEIIDIGNAYKSAEAKAIKNACSRWGVGLYLESNPYDEGFVEKPLPTEPSLPPMPDRPPDIKPAIPDIPPVGDLPKDPGVPMAPAGFTPPPLPPLEGEPKKEAGPFSTAPPDKPEEEVKTNDIMQEEMGAGSVTDVQRVAIQGLLQLKGLEFVALMTEALGKSDTLPTRVEDLTYQEAVTIIKYGNDINKK